MKRTTSIHHSGQGIDGEPKSSGLAWLSLASALIPAGHGHVNQTIGECSGDFSDVAGGYPLELVLWTRGLAFLELSFSQNAAVQLLKCFPIPENRNEDK